MARRVYEETAVLIDRLEMVKLWGYGFPVVPIYVFVLRQLLMYLPFVVCLSNREIAPELLDHFDNVGFALSILVTKWFIPLFSNTIPFSLLFRIWDYVFIKGIPGLFQIAVGLLVYFKTELMQCDLIQISEFLNSIGKKHLVKEREIQSWFSVVAHLEVGERVWGYC